MTEPKKPEADAPEDGTPRPTDDATAEENRQDLDSQGKDSTDTLDGSGLDAPAEGEATATGAERVDGAEGGAATPRDSVSDEIAEEVLHEAEHVDRPKDASDADVASDVGPEDGPDDTPDRGQDAEAEEVVDVPDQPGATEPAPVEVVERVVETKGGLIPGFFGGLVAAIGAVFAAPYVLPENLRPVTSLEPVQAEVAAVAEDVADVSARVEGAAPAADLATLSETLTARLDSLETDTAARLDALSARLDAEGAEVTAQIEELLRAPLENTDNPEMIAALEAFRREVEAVRGEVDAQTAANARLIEEAAAATAAAQQAAEAEVAAAEVRAAAAAQQQALVDVQAAIEAGEPFAEPLSSLSGVEIPEALSSVADSGVETLAALQASFSDPAREALDAARRATTPDDPADRGLSFLQRQLGVRSLAPQDGDSPDAVLSRAEAAARNGNLSEAVSELAALPEAAQEILADWSARATARADAVAAADALAQQLATN